MPACTQQVGRWTGRQAGCANLFTDRQGRRHRETGRKAETEVHYSGAQESLNADLADVSYGGAMSVVSSTRADEDLSVKYRVNTEE